MVMINIGVGVAFDSAIFWYLVLDTVVTVCIVYSSHKRSAIDAKQLVRHVVVPVHTSSASLCCTCALHTIGTVLFGQSVGTYGVVLETTNASFLPGFAFFFCVHRFVRRRCTPVMCACKL